MGRAPRSASGRPPSSQHPLDAAQQVLHVVAVFVRRDEMAQDRIERTQRPPLDAPGDGSAESRSRWFCRPHRAHLDTEEHPGVGREVAEQVELLLEPPRRWQVGGRRVGAVDDVIGRSPVTGWPSKRAPRRSPYSGQRVGGVGSGVHADDAERPGGRPFLHDAALLGRPKGVSPMVKSTSTRARSTVLAWRRRPVLTPRNSRPQRPAISSKATMAEPERLVHTGWAAVAVGRRHRETHLKDRRGRAFSGALQAGRAATTAISTRMFFSTAPVVARAG